MLLGNEKQTKTIDGLSGKSDEENLSFTYDVLDRYILNGEISDLDMRLAPSR